MILKLSNKENTYTFTVDDLNNGEKLYYKFQIPASDVVDGKYNMVLMDDEGNIITEEQVCMGYFNAETIQYNRGENVYINSPLNANLEDVRTITIDVPNYTIYPSEGYDAMKEVVVDAQPVYDNGYNEGETAQKAKLTGITITENGTYSREDGYNEITVDVPDLNGDYNEGYDAGKVDGYDSGYTAGEVEQKSKLTNITISENGTYTREDGYNTVVVDVPDTNGSYDEGYQAGIEEGTANAGEIIGETARVLNITENGIYTSEYSQWDDYPKPEIVTGVFEDGKEFFDYVNLKDNIFFIEKYVTNNSILEFWFKPLSIHNSYYSYILGNGADDNSKFGLYLEYLRWNLYFGGNVVNITLEEDKWYHILLSQEGAFVNNEKIGEYNITEFLSVLNIKIGFFNNFNHFFGMIKLDGDVYIPTENGFINYTTGSLLQKYNSITSTNYIYTNNFTEPVATGNLIRTVNVDIQPKIDVAETDLKFGRSTFAEIPEWADFSNVTNMSYMFSDCSSLKTIPLLNTSNVTDISNMFNNCSSLQTIPLLNTSNVTDMSYMFQGCGSLQTIPLLNTSNVTNMGYMFNNCKNLQTIPELDTRNVTNMGYMLYGGFGGMSFITLPKIYCDSCTNMTRHLSAIDVPTLTEVGGWINLKIDWKDNYGLSQCPNLTYQSCINVLNGLADVTELGVRTLKVHQNFLTTVGDEISIGTNKGWTITA